MRSNQGKIPTMKFPCYLHSTGGMAGDGTACDADDDGIDLFTSWACSTPTASEIQTHIIRQKIGPEPECLESTPTVANSEKCQHLPSWRGPGQD